MTVAFMAAPPTFSRWPSQTDGPDRNRLTLRHDPRRSTKKIIPWLECRERRKASRANPDDHHSHREANAHRSAERDHNIAKQTVSSAFYGPWSDFIHKDFHDNRYPPTTSAQQRAQKHWAPA
jgi:hypothetical protein